MKRRLLRRLIASGLGVAAALTVSTVTSGTAQAYPYSYVYVSFPTWLANCPAGGSVTGIFAANGDLWSTPAGGDWGDDLVYPKVNLNANNQISGQGYCNRPWYKGGSYWGPAVSATIYPTRGGQTFWIGPGGQTHN